MNAEIVTDTCQKPTLPVLPIVRLRGLAPMALTYLLAQILIAAQANGKSPALLSRTTIPTSTLRGHGVDMGRMLSWECDAPSVPSIVKRILQIASIKGMTTIIVQDHTEFDRPTEEQIVGAGITLIYA